MDIEIIREAIRRRKGRGHNSSMNYEEKEYLEPSAQMKKEKDQLEDGLAPDIQDKSYDENMEELELKEMSMQERAEKILGRKPMSMAKKKSSDMSMMKQEDESLSGPPDLNPDALEQMKDDRLMEDLAAGKRKGKSLREKVQMNIMNMMKK